MASKQFHMIADREICKKSMRNQFQRLPTEPNIYGLWYDWFCTEKALFTRGKKLWKAASSIVESTRFDADKCYVFFKNNCPAIKHPLYDDFRICDLETCDVLFTITHNAFGAKEWQVYDILNKGGAECAFKGTWDEVKKWFLVSSSVPDGEILAKKDDERRASLVAILNPSLPWITEERRIVAIRFLEQHYPEDLQTIPKHLILSAKLAIVV